MLKRLVTAAILLPLVIIAIIWLPAVPFVVISAALFILASWEWSRLAGWESWVSRIMFVLGFTLIEAAVLNPFTSAWITLFLYHLSLVYWPIVLLLVLTYPKTVSYWGNKRLLRSLMGYLAMAPCFFILTKFATEQFPREMLLLCLVFIWGADSGAYFAGKRWGKTPLIPDVSPKKTVEGLVGALLTGFFIVLVVFILSESLLVCTHGACKLSYLQFGSAQESFLMLMVIALWTILASVLGDLAISMFKRNVGVKDTGKLLPGHGGILDRIDSMLPALPVFVHFTLF
jgi:phosphatidate cytidylyltransferase